MKTAFLTMVLGLALSLASMAQASKAKVAASKQPCPFKFTADDPIIDCNPIYEIR